MINNKVYQDGVDLIIEVENEKYLIDSETREIKSFDEEAEFKREDPVFIPYKELVRDWNGHYDGK